MASPAATLTCHSNSFSGPQFSTVTEAEPMVFWNRATPTKDSSVLLSGGFSVNLYLCMLLLNSKFVQT